MSLFGLTIVTYLPHFLILKYDFKNVFDTQVADFVIRQNTHKKKCHGKEISFMSILSNSAEEFSLVLLAV